jgi:hypothetical protein
MNGDRRRRLLGALVASATVLAIGATGAHGDGGPPLGPAPQADCLASPAPRLARGTRLHSYDDYIEDVVSAPDICASNVVTNDNEVFTIFVHLHDRSAFAALDSYRVLLDTDSSPATGGSPDPAVVAGAEYVIDLAAGASRLSSWTGAAFAPVAVQPSIPTEWIEGYGPALQIERAALGDPKAFGVIFATANGADRDLAPDTGSWPYTTTPLRLTAGRLAVAPARAGAPLRAEMEVTRSDFDVPLDEGRIACGAKLAGKTLAGRGRFTGDVVRCTWRLPQDARGKRVRGSVAVTFQQVTATRSFRVRVR